MKKILIAWELGTAYGHIGAFPALAETLRRQQCEVSFALNEFDKTSGLLTELGFECLRAPAWKHYRGVVRPLSTYPELLQRYGFADPDRLLPVVLAWRELFREQAPDLIVTNHAPTALLATAGLDPATVRFGTGFECPPKTSPFPVIAPRQESAAEDLQDTELRVLDTINRICDSLGAPSRQSVSELFDTDADFLCTLAELDPYHEYRGIAEYWGPQTRIYRPRLQDWRPRRRDSRIFAYLQPYYARLSETLTALREHDSEVVVYCPGLPVEFAAPYVAENLSFVSTAIATRELVTDFDLVVSHGGHGTAAALLLGGRPHFMLPMHLEHRLNADAVAGLGAGGFVAQDDDSRDIATELSRMLANDDLADGARAFARRYRDFDQDLQTDSIARRMLRLCT